MFLLSRYLLKNTALTTFFMCTVLTLIIWLTQTLRLLDFVINGGAPFRLFGAMLFLTIPRFFEVILPLSLALGVVYSLNKFSSDSELVVMQNSGLSPFNLGKAIIAFALLVATFLFILSGWLTPMANREMDRLRNVVKSDYSLGLLRPGVFNLVSDDTTVYIAERTNLQDLKGVFIHTNNPGEPPTTITAEHGGFITQNGKPLIVVFDGLRQQFNPQTGMVDMLKFERYSLDLSNLMQRIEKMQLDPNERTLTELWGNQNQDTGNIKLDNRLRAELHTRMSRPFLVLAFTLISLVPFLIGRFNRRGHALRVGIIIAVLIVVQAIHLGASSFAVTSDMGIVLLYGVPLALIFGYGMLLMNDADYYRSGKIFTFKDRLI